MLKNLNEKQLLALQKKITTKLSQVKKETIKQKKAKLNKIPESIIHDLKNHLKNLNEKHNVTIKVPIEIKATYVLGPDLIADEEDSFADVISHTNTADAIYSLITSPDEIIGEYLNFGSPYTKKIKALEEARKKILLFKKRVHQFYSKLNHIADDYQVNKYELIQLIKK